jgi:hypothetical protein
MEELTDTLVFYAIALIYPVVTGPLAVYLLLLSLRGDRRHLVLYWAGLLGLHVAGFFLLTATLGDFLPGPGAVSCFLTPLIGTLTGLGLAIASRRLRESAEADSRRSRVLLVGAIVLPLLQFIVVFLVALLAPTR